jgi:hypothetical protein
VEEFCKLHYQFSQHYWHIDYQMVRLKSNYWWFPNNQDYNCLGMHYKLQESQESRNTPRI